MITYKFLVHDDGNIINDCVFDDFANAFDYAQPGLITFIEVIPFKDGIEDEENSRIIWSWDDVHSKEQAIEEVNKRLYGFDDQANSEEEYLLNIADTISREADYKKGFLGENAEFFDVDFELDEDTSIVDCEKNKLISHAQDEKPLDCKQLHKPLERPLTEEKEVSFEFALFDKDGNNIPFTSFNELKKYIDTNKLIDYNVIVKNSNNDTESFLDIDSVAKYIEGYREFVKEDFDTSIFYKLNGGTKEYLSEAMDQEADEKPKTITTYEIITKGYEQGHFDQLPCNDKTERCFADIYGLDKPRLVGYFSKRPEFTRVDHDDEYASSTEFISDKYDIEIFDNFISIYKVSGRPVKTDLKEENIFSKAKTAIKNKLKPTEASLNQLFTSFQVFPADSSKHLLNDKAQKNIQTIEKAISEAELLSKTNYFAYVYGQTINPKFGELTLRGKSIKDIPIYVYYQGKLESNFSSDFEELYHLADKNKDDYSDAQESPSEVEEQTKEEQTAKETVENNKVDKEKEEKQVQEPKIAKANKAKEDNNKIIKAFDKLGLDDSKLVVTVKDKNGREYKKASDTLKALRKELFGEKSEE